MKLELTPVFVGNIRQAFGAEGQRYLDDLPGLLEQAARRWDLVLGEPFLLSYNYVCAATRADGSPAVLKIGMPNRELSSEINTLRLYAGEGACRLLEADPEGGMLLVERLRPGTMLVELPDDQKRTEIAAGVLGRIQRTAPPDQDFLSLRGWFDGLKSLRPRFSGGTGPFPGRIVSQVEGLLAELFAEQAAPQVLLHGDFHHYNILASERGWLVIDPKGVVGAAEYDACPFLLNPLGPPPPEAQAIRQTQNRMAIFCERLGWDRQRLWRWALCFSLLTSWWDLAEDGSGGEEGRAWMEILAKIKV
jgi:streptomycin 6-kinase